MKLLRKYIFGPLGTGLLIVIPIYLALLLLLKGMKSLGALVRPLANLLPEWLPAENVLSLLLILIVCLLIGLSMRTAAGRAARSRIEKSLFERIPGYALIRSLTQRMAGTSQETAWKPALAEIEDALVPAFIIEEIDDERLAVFVPSVPTPLAGAVYIISRDRVHPVDVPFTQAASAVARWGSGSKELVAAMSPGVGAQSK
jgi:uncharacterized membrane protein